MTKVVAIANQKGGVAKTTTAINLGAALAMAERKTLIVDMDPQGHSTSGLGVHKYAVEYDIYHALMGSAPISDVIQPTGLEYLKIVPSNKNLVGAEIELVEKQRREYRLLEALVPALHDFEHIFIDCPPSLGLLTINAMVAAEGLLIPIQTEYFALEGVSELVDTVKRVRLAFNPGLRIIGVLLTMADERTNLTQQVHDEVARAFGDRVFKTVIPRNVRLAEAPSFGKPIMLYDISSKGARAYLELAKEFTRDGQAKGVG
jgi:chromosome partitioning protein